MLRSGRRFRPRELARDVFAGFTLLAISIPLNIGYAQIAGLPATAGLYALILPTLTYVALVSSRTVVASPDAAASALVFSSLLAIGAEPADLSSLAAAQAVLCGAVLVGASLLRWGFLADFLSHPILVGFIAGLALEVMLSQAHKMIGIPRGDAEGFFPELGELALSLPAASPIAAGMSAVALTVLLVARRMNPAIPGALIVLVAATVATVVLRLDEVGLDVLGEVTGGLPVLSLPNVGLEQWAMLVPSAVALAAITMAEGVLLSRAYAERHGYLIDADRDLRAFGAANVVAGVSGSFAIGASASRSAAMDAAGSRSQVPSIVVVVGTSILLIAGTQVLAAIPTAVIGAVVAVAIIPLLGVRELRRIARISRGEFVVAISCLLGVLVLGPLVGLLLAFVLSLINLARRASRPEIDAVAPGLVEPRGTPHDDILVVRIAGPIFFANQGVLRDRVLRLVADAPVPVRALVVDAEGIADVDVTGAMTTERLLDQLQRDGITVVMSRLRPGLRDRFQQLGVFEDLTEYPTNAIAVAALREGGPGSGVSP